MIRHLLQFLRKLKDYKLSKSNKIQMAWVIKNLYTQKVLQANKAGQVFAAKQNKGHDQRWIIQEGNLNSSIKNLATGAMLQVTYPGEVQARPSNGNYNQQWQFRPAQYQVFYLINYESGKRLQSNKDGELFINKQQYDDRYQKWQKIWTFD